MQKIFGVLFILVAVWIAIEVYTKGTDAAFGGLFASHSHGQASVESGGPLTDRVRERVKGSVRTHEERTLQQTDPDEQRAEP
jgi:hypothetical protein